MTIESYIKCGDCFDLMPEIPDHSADMVICDLPYGMTMCKWDSVLPLDAIWAELKRIAKDNAAIVMFGSQPFTSTLVQSNLADFRYELIWEKQQGTNPMVAKRQILKKHEDILVFYRKQPTYNPQMSYDGSSYPSYRNEQKRNGEVYGGKVSMHRECTDGSRYPTSILRFNTERNGYHPTQKPIALLEYLIRTYTNDGDMVFDCCMGSGSTCVAAIRTGRGYIGFEKEPKYFEVAKERIAAAEGEKENNA